MVNGIDDPLFSKVLSFAGYLQEISGILAMDLAGIGKSRRIIGIDFSGAKSACDKIWLTEGFIDGGRFHVQKCYSARDLLSGKKADRDTCLSALRDLISNSNGAIFGVDFPFSINYELMHFEDWESFVLAFPNRYLSADQFRNDLRSRMNNVELKRLTDIEVKAPFSLYNLRVYRQTYFAIRDIVYPLLVNKSACILPMQTPCADRPWLLEICPAALLKQEGLYKSYKGRSEKTWKSREFILEKLIEMGVSIDPDTKCMILENSEGDALDSLIAAFTTSLVVPRLDHIMSGIPDVCFLEGYTFL